MIHTVVEREFWRREEGTSEHNWQLRSESPRAQTTFLCESANCWKRTVAARRAVLPKVDRQMSHSWKWRKGKTTRYPMTPRQGWVWWTEADNDQSPRAKPVEEHSVSHSFLASRHVSGRSWAIIRNPMWVSIFETPFHKLWHVLNAEICKIFKISNERRNGRQNGAPV